jgi:hypothetical protein
MSLIRRAGGRILKILQQITGTDPAGIAGQVQVYAKDSGGTAQLFAVDGDGTPHQLTPAGGGGGGGSNVFVFQPDGDPGGNVYDDWGTLVDACNEIQGRRYIEFDNQFASIEIPDGTWDMFDVVWIGTPQGFMASTSIVDVELGNVELPGLREIHRVRLINGAGDAPIDDFDEGDVFIMDNATLLNNDEGPLLDFSGVVFKVVAIQLRNGSSLQDDSEEAITGVDTCILNIEVDETSFIQSDSIEGSGGEIHIFTRTPDVSVSHNDFSGQIILHDRMTRYNSNVSFQSSDFTPLPGTINYVDSSVGQVNVNLPPASQADAGSVIVIKNANDYVSRIRVASNGGDAIDGEQAQYITEPFGFIVAVSTGGGWYISSRDADQNPRGAWEIHQNWLPPNFAAWSSSVVGGATNVAALHSEGLSGPVLRQTVVANNDRASKYLPNVLLGDNTPSGTFLSFRIYELTFELDTADLVGTPNLVYQAGFIHDESAEPSTEDFIKIYKSSASPNWFFRSRGPGETNVDTGIAVSGGVQRFKIYLRGSSFTNNRRARLYIDDTFAAEISDANFPQDDAMTIAFYLKSTGATNSSVDVSPVWLKVKTRQEAP